MGFLTLGAEANEFYFQGHSKSVAPWRFHEEEGKREYKLKVRQTKAGCRRIWFRIEAFWPVFEAFLGSGGVLQQLNLVRRGAFMARLLERS